MTSYKALEKHFEEINALEHAAAILAWDEAAMMPPASGDARAVALATLAGVIHEKVCNTELADLIADAAENDNMLNNWQTANLREITRRWRHAAAIPADLVYASSRANSLCEQTWRTCRSNNDWQGVIVQLEEVVELAKQVAVCLGESESISPYNALLDKWEPGLREEAVDVVFDDLRDFLPPFIDEVIARQSQSGSEPLPGPFPVENQNQLALTLMKSLGFDTAKGRLDESHHPFCGGVADDTRITTRYSEEEFLTALMAVLHETGHALYQQGLPADWRRQPVGDALGMAIHESQSLLMEMQVCRSRDFINYASPIIQEKLHASPNDPAWSTDNLHRQCLLVEKGYIRVFADELTYPLHVILRYEIEKKLIQGALSVRDIPEIWNQHMQSALGLCTEDNYRDGCMQDVHWFSGTFGYFPSYTLGALTAAQFYRTAIEANAEIPSAVSAGDFTPLLDWLRANIHAQGRLMNADALIQNATGALLETRFFKDHVQARYLTN
jgi:carboxypeptidase Taq